MTGVGWSIRRAGKEYKSQGSACGIDAPYLRGCCASLKLLGQRSSVDQGSVGMLCTCSATALPVTLTARKLSQARAGLVWYVLAPVNNASFLLVSRDSV